MPHQKSTSQKPKAAGRISVLRDQHLVPLLTSAQPDLLAEQPLEGVLLERHLVRPGEIPTHEHPDLVLHLQLSGDREFEWWSGRGNSIEQTRPGSLILIPPGTMDRLYWSGPSERLILSIRQNRLVDLARELGSVKAPEFKVNWSLHDASIQHLIAEMGREASGGWPLGRLYADLLTTGLETHLLKSHAADRLRTPSLKGGLSLPRLKRAMEYINSNMEQEIRLEEIANELDLSPSHFAHQFRNATSQTPYQYLLDQRIARAKDLLKRTDFSVQYISGLAGFRSPVNFVRTFRQRVGLTPDAWRRSL